MILTRHPALAAFIAEYLAETKDNPLSRNERVWQMRAGFEVSVFNNAVRLSCVRSFERGKGDGSAALDWLCAMADRHGVPIEGSIQPVGDQPRLSSNELRRWYKKRHFITNRHGDIRRPAQPLRSAATNARSQ
jgi:hypothetical protein